MTSKKRRSSADRVLVLSERPARIEDEVRADAASPSQSDHADVVFAMHRILTTLGLEARVGLNASRRCRREDVMR